MSDENVINHNANLECSFDFVPNVKSDQNHLTIHSMRLVLTNRRLAIRFWDGKARKSFFTSTIHSFTERKLSSDQPNWPYQVVLMLTGGLILTIQTQKVDKTQQDKLSSAIHQAFRMFNSHAEDLDAITAFVAFERQKRNR